MIDSPESQKKEVQNRGWRKRKPFGILRGIFFSFPVQLLLIHLKKNFSLLLIWGILFGIITGHIGKEFGIPYLFLDPEYLGRVSWLSMFIMGLAMGGFSLAFQVTSYSLESNRFSFLGYLRVPFGKFFLNNSIIPVLFIVVYIINFIKFQTESEYISTSRILLEAFSFLGGFTVFVMIFFNYLVGTNKDIFIVLGPSVAKKSEQHRLKRIKSGVLSEPGLAPVKVLYYLELPWKIRKVNTAISINPDSIKQVFAQNHLNAIIMEIALIFSLLVMGSFAGRESVHIPAGASLLLFFTILVMVAGWFSYYFKEWTAAFMIIFFIVFNLMTSVWYRGNQGGSGLDYGKKPAVYSISALKALASDSIYHRDKIETTQILENWRKKFSDKPKMVFVCCSGGGQRAAIWTIRNLQMADSMAGGNLMKHTVLITGASGGMIGAAFYRELYLRKMKGARLNINDLNFAKQMGQDNLNAIMFNFVVNDIFFRSLTFNYLEKSYYHDRGEALEAELNHSTNAVLDKSITDYKQPEADAIIPMMILSPTIINDGRKLYVSPQNISYMVGSDSMWRHDNIRHVQAVEFDRFFANQGAGKLRFLTALRMSATFPYISPTVELPSLPSMQVMDAGMTDNYGIDDALKFTFVFRDWIRQNTSGVVMLSIRDASSEKRIEQERHQTLAEKIFSTIGGFYAVWEDIQNNYNDAGVSYARAWLGTRLDYIELPYVPDFNAGRNMSRDSISLKVVRGASLSWHLTRFEKENIQQSISRPENLKAFARLKKLVN